MKFKLLVVLFCAIGLSSHSSFAQITESPRVEEQSAKYVKIKRVELTDNYTIIHLQFSERSGLGQQGPLRLPDFKGQQQQGAGSIWLDPETRLYKPGDINTKFRFIKAENIPTDQQRKSVAAGETVDFVAYFERLTPGIEIFDFYEGRAQSKTEQTWNFYGVHITNPLKKTSSKKSSAPQKNPAVQKEEIEEAPLIKEKEPVRAVEEEAYGVIKGTVYDGKTKQPIPAEISYVEKGDSLQIKSSSGKFRIGLDPKESYTLKVLSKGYYGESKELSLADSAGKTSFNHDFYLSPLKVGETIAMPNLYFETSKFTLLRESFAELDKLASMMRDNPQIRIRVEGHTDNVGDFDKNIELSTKRAESVKQYLVEKGIESSRIEARGYGATRPLTKSGSEEQRRKNRRVEFVITNT
ncbi:Peptidoglycan-associated lipoprotein [Dyadobacter sp. CECT 9275]|uniref:Peptidoglycan-associated lipoprotein n=1 Tax=Dyadobacter helix TaxID=2822344 RepID=A0A916JGF6_9BACT|nr:OmpA family protein [Dyadobacter sp. CECT 9275]CAG5011498.1 Peptidoglycan-associated lipoprotein [Dyadobacter sp. CECT 9275]